MEERERKRKEERKEASVADVMFTDNEPNIRDYTDAKYKHKHKRYKKESKQVHVPIGDP